MWAATTYACKSRGVKVGWPSCLPVPGGYERETSIARDPSTREFNGSWFGYEVTGSVLGIVRMGKIGIKVAQCALGFGMRILYNKRRRQEEDIERALSAEYYQSLHNMLPKCDFVMLVIPLGPKRMTRCF